MYNTKRIGNDTSVAKGYPENKAQMRKQRTKRENIEEE